MKNFNQKFIEILIHPARYAKMIITRIMIALIPLTYLLVHLTGGIKFVYSHTMYIPIVVLAIIYGVRGGLFAAIIGGLLLGPLMAIDVQTGESQELMNWIYRMLIFVVIGGTVGFFASRIRHQAESITKMALTNSETKIPIFTMINQSLSSEEFLNRYQDETYVFSIVNGSDIIELLGKDFYNNLIITVMDKLVIHFNQQISLYQIDTTRFVVLVEHSFEGDFKEQLMRFFDDAFTVDEIPIHLSIVVGISASGKSIFSKIEEAILATNIAKSSHVQVSVFDQSILPSKTDISIVGAFKKALDDGEMYLVYQPVHHINTNKVEGLEALIRWNHPEHGLLMPARFIHLIENTQLINYLSEFVIRQAFTMLKKLDKDVIISVNLSANNFYSRFFINKIFGIIEQEKADSSRMVFEITESILMEHPKKSVEIMDKFKAKGIKFAIDDFGTGYSSLAYVNLFPVDYLKIDRYFIKQMHEQSIHKIIKSTIELAHELGFYVIAEGVEKDSDIGVLKSLSCDYIQGFTKSVPLKEREILLYIKENELSKSSS